MKEILKICVLLSVVFASFFYENYYDNVRVNKLNYGILRWIISNYYFIIDL